MRSSDHIVRALKNKDFSWHHLGACLGAPDDIFFAEPDSTTQYRERAKQAKEICAGCKVKTKCLEQASENGESAYIWGGLTSDERREIHRDRKRRGLK